MRQNDDLSTHGGRGAKGRGPVGKPAPHPYLCPMIEGPQPTGKLWPKIKRGLAMTCPNCGNAKLFRAFLKPVDHCSSCGVNWGEVRADDGPAWASMLVAGHLTAPVFHWVVFKTDIPTWTAITVISLLLAVLCIALLQPMKGLFMAIIWAKGAPTSG